MSAKITRLHPWRPSRKAVADFTEVCRQTGLDKYLRMDEPTGADVERLAREIGQAEDWQPPGLTGLYCAIDRDSRGVACTTRRNPLRRIANPG